MAYRPPSIRPKQHVVLSPPTPPTLSPELWLMIWERTWEPRIVEVHSIIKFQSRDRMRLFDSEQYRSSAPLPFTLFINRKSRHFTQLHYRRGFPASFLDRDLCKHSRVYFNSKLDTLYLRDPDMFWTSNQLKRFRLCDLKWVKYLALDERIFQHFVTYHHFSADKKDNRLSRHEELLSIRYHWRFTRGMKNLSELYVVLGDSQHEQLSQAVGWWPICEMCDIEEGTRITIDFNAARSYLLNDIIPSHVGSPLNMRIIASRLSDLRQAVDFNNNARNDHLALAIPKHRARPLELLFSLRRLKAFKDELLPHQLVDWKSFACWCRVEAGFWFDYAPLRVPGTNTDCRRELRKLCYWYLDERADARRRCSIDGEWQQWQELYRLSDEVLDLHN